MMHKIGAELRTTLRSLRKKLGFAAAVMLTMALGIGVFASTFSIVHGVLIKPLPYPGVERMVYAPRQVEDGGTLRWYWSHLDYQYVKERVTSFELLEGVRLGSVVMTGRDKARRMFIRYVTPRFLDMYGATCQSGRGFSSQEDRIPGGHPVLLISHKLWQTAFGGRPDTVGEGVNLSGKPYTIQCVLNPEFEYPFGQDIGSTVDLFVGKPTQPRSRKECGSSTQTSPSSDSARLTSTWPAAKGRSALQPT